MLVREGAPSVIGGEEGFFGGVEGAGVEEAVAGAYGVLAGLVAADGAFEVAQGREALPEALGSDVAEPFGQVGDGQAVRFPSGPQPGPRAFLLGHRSAPRSGFPRRWSVSTLISDYHGDLRHPSSIH
ncbi:hypothetical protein ABZ914_11510 [Spirillospora sp. NPDC046719]